MMNTLLKIFLLLSFIVLLGVGGFSLYKIFIEKGKGSNIQIAQNQTPSIIPSITIEKTPSPIPSPFITTIPSLSPTIIPIKTLVNPTVSKSLTPTSNLTPSPTKIPTPSLTIAPTLKISVTPTQTLSPTIKPSPILTSVPKESLPVAGNSYPTFLLISFGIVSFLTAIFFYKY